MQLRECWRRPVRALQVAVTAAAAALPGACHARPETRVMRDSTIDGLFSFVVGDPHPGGDQSAYRAYVTAADGRAVSVVLDTSVAGKVGSLRRFQGARVRITGRFVAPGSETFLFRAIDSLMTPAMR